MKYHLSLVFEARQVGNDYDEDVATMRWCNGTPVDPTRADAGELTLLFTIDTLDGIQDVRAGDWVIQGVAGEFYPCKPDVFASTYTPATPGCV